MNIRREGVTGFINTLRAGETLGEVSLFDGGRRSATCTAMGRCSLYRLDHAALTRQLAVGSPMARKLFRHLAHSLGRVLRVSVLRLRAAAALEHGERDAAHRAREEARQLAESEARRPREGADWVAVDDDASSAAACIATAIRLAERPVSLDAVREAVGDGASAEKLVHGAATLGVRLRRLRLDSGELRWMQNPMLFRPKEGSWVLARRATGQRCDAIDPMTGPVTFPRSELEERFTGVCYELVVDEPRSGTLGRRLGWSLGRHRGVLWQLAGTTLALQMFTLGLPLATGLMIERAIPSGEVHTVALVGIAALVAALAYAVSGWIRGHAIRFLQAHLDLDLLGQLMRHVLRLPLAFFERHDVGQVLQRFEAFRAVRRLLGTRGITALLDLPTLIVSLIAIAVLDIRLFVVVLLSALATAASYGLWGRRMMALAERGIECAARTRARLLEVFGGTATLRVAGERRLGVRLWQPRAASELDVAVGQAELQGRMSAVLGLIRNAGVVSVLGLGAFLVLDGTLALGTMMAVLGLAASLLGAVSRVGENAGASLRASSQIRLLNETFEEPPEQEEAARAHPGRLSGRVRLEKVSFAYGPYEPDVLKEVSLDIPAGANVALVGGSGSGKSTLGKLLLGLHTPTSGRVLLDERDLDSLDLAAVRRQVGVVPQEGFLFAGSLRSNITITAPHARLDRVKDAAERASIADVIEALPMKYGTIVPQGGGTMSGGQRQRVALARALVSEPSLLLLDEATSALDNVSQAAVERNLEDLRCTRASERGLHCRTGVRSAFPHSLTRSFLEDHDTVAPAPGSGRIRVWTRVTVGDGRRVSGSRRVGVGSGIAVRSSRSAFATAPSCGISARAPIGVGDATPPATSTHGVGAGTIVGVGGLAVLVANDAASSTSRRERQCAGSGDTREPNRGAAANPTPGGGLDLVVVECSLHDQVTVPLRWPSRRWGTGSMAAATRRSLCDGTSGIGRRMRRHRERRYTRPSPSRRERSAHPVSVPLLAERSTTAAHRSGGP